MILVTGGAGYIGSVVAERLIARGEEVCVFDNLGRGHRDAVPADALFVEADLADRDRLRSVLRDNSVHAVIHFAAFALVGESMEKPGLYFHNNLTNTLGLLEESQRAGVERIVFSSSCAIFGDRNPSPLSREIADEPHQPLWGVETGGREGASLVP